MNEPRQASVELVCAADHTSCGVHHSLQLVGRRLWRACQDGIAVVDARSDECVDECAWISLTSEIVIIRLAAYTIA